MKQVFAVLAFSLIGMSANAQQTLEQALSLNPKLKATYEALKEAAGMECDTKSTFVSKKITGLESRMAVTHQAPCYDPNAFNPSQLGQLFVTFYGTAENETSAVGELIAIDFEIWK